MPADVSSLKTEDRWYRVWEFVVEVMEMQPRTLAMMQRHGFVFETDMTKPDADRTPAERWEKLAFTLYSNLCELTGKAEALLSEDTA